MRHCSSKSVLSAITLLQLFVSGQSCGRVGQTYQDEISGGVTTSAFYLNPGDPASCNGVIASVHYCFSADQEQTVASDQYLVTFAIYRRNNVTSYSNVTPATALQVTGQHLQDDLESDSFGCSTYTLDQLLPIQAGDVLGVCVFDPPGLSQHRIDLVKEFSLGSSNNLLRIDSVLDSCTEATVPKTVNSNSPFNFNGTLYLYAEIEFEHIPVTTDSKVTLTSTTTPVATTGTRFPDSEASSSPTESATSNELTSTEPTVDQNTTVPDSKSSTAGPTVGLTTKVQASTVETKTLTASPVSTSSEQPISTYNLDEFISTESGPTDNDAQQTTTDDSDSTIEQIVDDGRTSNSIELIVGVVVVVALFAIIVSTIALVVVIVMLKRRRRETKNKVTFNATNNQLYFDITGDLSASCGLDGSHPGEKVEKQLTEALNHTCQPDSSSSENRSNEPAYAEVGRHGVTEMSIEDYESPIDATAVSYANLLEKNKKENIYMGVNSYEVPASREHEIYAQLKTWGVRHIKTHEIEVADHLGSGQFGSVEQGVWKRQGTRPVDVALKSLTRTSGEDKVKFLQEAAIMAQFRHPNVIMLYGVVTGGSPMMLVVELAKKGDLRGFLCSIKPDPGELVSAGTPNMLLKFSQQVALGMQYLSAKGFVHRDLAARNVLLTSDHVCKVADFGLSRDLADENYYISQGRDKIPIRWTAPEAINYKKYSTASDVWSYGCLLYEIWSLGCKPFEGISNLSVVRRLEDGERLSPPPGCPKMIYELMILCWHPETSQRFTFHDIVLTLVGSEETVLNIPEEDSSTNPLAGVLGAPLEAGENMYSELHGRYACHGSC